MKYFSLNQAKTGPDIWRIVEPVGIFLLALLPRLVALQFFVTADEAKWVHRSAQFLAALLRGDYAATAVNLTPAVTTTWLGSLGLTLYYRFHLTEIERPFIEWLNSLPPFRAELPVLAAVRLPMVLFTALATTAIYLLARRLWGHPIALLGAILISLDPHTLALSRIIGHDAPAAMFMTLALLALLLATEATSTGENVQKFRLGGLIFSGGMAGLAFLSKSPAFFLIPFGWLILLAQQFANPQQRRGATVISGVLGPAIKGSLRPFCLWLLIAYATFIALWPAAWVAPISQPYAVLENAFFSATNLDETSEISDLSTEDNPAESDSGGSVPNLGPFYYLVNAAFKLSPLVSIGVIVALIGRHSHPRALAWLPLFAFLFMLFMTLGGKRSNRYILPIFPVLALWAAYGWSHLRLLRQGAATLPALASGLLLLSGLTLIPYAPYYYTYFNPLLGGPLSAPHLIKIGWGEGLDEVGRWLESQPDAAGTRTGSWYASALSPFYSGDIADVTSSRLDYIVAYIKQTQDGQPTPEIARYFQAQMPHHTVRLGGIDYAQIYPGPAARLAPPELTTDYRIAAFRPHTDYVPIGQTLTVDLIRQVGSRLSSSPPALSLYSGDHLIAQESAADPILTAPPVYRYTFALPPTLAPGEVTLKLNGQSLGSLRAYYVELPIEFQPIEAPFGDQVQLVGFDPDVSISDSDLTIRLAFRATPKAWADYTIFVHLIDAAGNRLSGHDAPPIPPTSQWAKTELVPDHHTLPLPPDLSPAQTYHLRVGLYRSDTGEPLGEPAVLPLNLTLP